MTNYNYDSKANTFYGPLDRMPPDKTLESIVDDIEAFSIYEPLWNAFHTYLSTLHSIPHTFTGHSRIVPEGEIEWRYEINDLIQGWIPMTKVVYDACHPDDRRRVATPKITEGEKGDWDGLKKATEPLLIMAGDERVLVNGKPLLVDFRIVAEEHYQALTSKPSIPAHIVDDMKLDSYYDGFKDGQAMAGKPNNRADGTGPEFYCQRYFEENPLCENQCDHCKAYYEPLTVQPDKPEDKTPRQIADEKYGNDPMYQLIALQLDIALDGAQKKVKDPTKYILDELRKRGFEVIKPSPQTGEKEPPQWKLWEEVVYCVLTNNKDGAKEQLTKNYHITPIKK